MDNTIRPVCTLLCSLIFCVAVTAPMPAPAAGQAMLELIEILRDKGSLTDEEYRLLRDTALVDSDIKADRSDDNRVSLRAQDTQSAAGSWTDNIRLEGDIRLRSRYDNETNTNSNMRGRVRYRAGIIGTPAENLEVGGGLASGTDDQRSTNQTFEESFSTKGLGLDYAYAQYRFNDSFKAVGGKLKKGAYLYSPTDLIWDTDINPEGASGNYSFNSPLGAAFVNGGVWVLEHESDSKDDPHMIYAQLGQRWRRDNLYANVAASYYNFADITSLDALSKAEFTNTDTRFDSFGLSGEFGVRNIFGDRSSATLILDYIRNFDTATPADTGYSIGVAASKRQWSFKYLYADLEANAWPDFLPDSDRFDGLTGIKGHEFILGYSLWQNVDLILDYYMMEDTVSNIDQDLLQADVVIDF